MSTVFFFLFFCILAVVLISTALGLNFLESQRKKQVKSMLRTVEGNPSEQADTHILFEADDSDDLMARFRGSTGLNTWKPLCSSPA
jgi:hypothetical protein